MKLYRGPFVGTPAVGNCVTFYGRGRLAGMTGIVHELHADAMLVRFTYLNSPHVEVWCAR